MARAPVHLAGPSGLLCTRVLPAPAPLVAECVRLRVATGLTEPLIEELRLRRSGEDLCGGGQDRAAEDVAGDGDAEAVRGGRGLFALSADAAGVRLAS
ncbi:hypothetical protein ACWDLG_22700 [Nonomuraea sp. NPDC003727]